MGRLDVLRDVKAGRVRVMEVYERFRQGKVHEIPSGPLMRPLRPMWEAWLEGKDIAARTQRDYQEAWQRLSVPRDATFADLTTLLKAHRSTCPGVRPRTFNKDRAAILAFLSSELGEAHWLSLDCGRLDPLKIADDRKLPYNPLTVVQAKGVVGEP